MSDVISRFEFRPPTADTIPAFETVRAAVIDLARKFDELLPECREKALAITQLEQTHFWSNAAIARCT